MIAGTGKPRRKKRKGARPWGYDSRGVPFAVGCLPVLSLMVVMGLTFWLVPDLFFRCLGHEPGTPSYSGRGAGLAILLGEMACSWVMLSGPWQEIALFLGFWGSLAAMLWAWRWTKRHQAYWAPIRARERAKAKERRAKRRREREAAKAAAAGDPPAGE